MKVTITSIELKGPFQFFVLSRQALGIVRQLRATDCLGFKKKGLWTTHYTMTLWKDEKELRDFAKSGAHLNAMRESAKIAKEIKTLTIAASTLPSWKEATDLLKAVKPIRYD